ncbi:AraC family transcriptional regulator ligand-binding domain-containing protein [Sphingorhabdus sp. Alg231-15]|uniref:AraC family transcriptional regulator ligand-binding domain-containing protein n=1 Tax=Sphingorhabdus sp. Alg231-15 TaxID=1922222 RepID=UPI000D5557F6
MNPNQDHFDRPVLSPQIANLILDILGEQGIPAHQLFSRLDFDHGQLASEDSYLSFHQMFALINAALRLSPTPWLGLKVGDSETIGTWGVLGYALMSSASELEAAEIGPKYYQAAPSLMQTRTAIEDSRQRIEMTPVYPAERLVPFCVEENMMGICKVASEYLQEPVRALEISLTYPKPVYSRKYEEYFDCPIHYNADRNILWTRAPTDRPLRNSDAASARICLKLTEEMVQRNRDEDDFMLTVRRELLRNPGNMSGMEQVASELAMSSRTLRRKLTSLQTSFRALQDDVRKNLALDYLRNTQLNIDQIAHRLGYSETVNFRRAFKHWTNHPPSHFRG